MSDLTASRTALPVDNATSTSTTTQATRYVARLAVPVVLAIAMLQGLLYMLLLPPWQHYDEPSHFEYAWLIANRDYLWQRGGADLALRRELVNSMQAHGFYHNQPRPDLLSERVWIGFSALGQHPPGYYALVSLPLRLGKHLDITTQLYVARFVSVILFVLTIAIALGIMHNLTPPGHPLRWAVPLAMTLLPPFVDLMTAVNNDVGAVLAASLLLWGTVQLICCSITWWRIAWVLAAAMLAASTKNTAAVLLALLPLAFAAALWLRQGWRWRWLGLTIGGAGLLLALTAIGWGDAAYWYRWLGAEQQQAPTQRLDPAAPLGAHVLVLATPARGQPRHLVAPILDQDVWALTGQTVTFGGWLWANRPARIPAPHLTADPSVNTATRASPAQAIDVTTTPTFVVWTFAVPADIRALHYLVTVDPAVSGPTPLQLFLDGAVLAQGTFPPNDPPVFDDSSAHTGLWGGTQFTNLIRNGSAEAAWPRLRPWVQRTLAPFLSFGWGRTPAQLFAVLLDWQRTSTIFTTYVGFIPLDSFFTGLAWGHIRLTHPFWLYLMRGTVAAAAIGCVWWSLRRPRPPSPAHLRAILTLFALAIVLAWANTAMRAMPKFSEAFVIPVARYAFPVMIPTMLACIGGWYALWPRRVRTYALIILLLGLLILNIASVSIIWSFYQTVSATST